jgi:RimJ/RimL family protein N-acetyltransferase
VPDFPKLRKAKRIEGKTLVFRDVKTSDAAFILSLRTDSLKSKHLSKTSPELDKQIAWLKSYENKINEAYFIIESSAEEQLGTVRLYDQQDDSFCWGSWILKSGAPQSAAIESALMVYSYAIDLLGFKRAHFDVRKENESVWRFHERFGAVRFAETELDYLYAIDYDKIKSSQKRYQKYLNSPLVIEE